MCDTVVCMRRCICVSNGLGRHQTVLPVALMHADVLSEVNAVDRFSHLASLQSCQARFHPILYVWLSPVWHLAYSLLIKQNQALCAFH
jgi:hypothetical protein